MNNRTIGICKLCKKNKKLCNSHIIPKFTINYLKRTSATPYLRYGLTPNIRRQDAIKIPLLCEDCEEMLSKWEDKFSKEIFVPFKEKNLSQIKYKKWLPLFAISLSWKILIEDFEKFQKEYPSLKKDIIIVENSWRKMILEQKPDTEKYEHYLIFLNKFQNNKNILLPPKLYRYLLRSCDGCIVSNEKQTKLHCYTKLSNIIIWSCIKPPNIKEYRKVRIKLQGTIKASQIIKNDAKIGEFLIRRAEYVTNLYNKMSTKQKDKIKNLMFKNPQKNNQIRNI